MDDATNTGAERRQAAQNLKKIVARQGPASSHPPHPPGPSAPGDKAAWLFHHGLVFEYVVDRAHHSLFYQARAENTIIANTSHSQYCCWVLLSFVFLLAVIASQDSLIRPGLRADITTLAFG